MLLKKEGITKVNHKWMAEYKLQMMKERRQLRNKLEEQYKDIGQDIRKVKETYFENVCLVIEHLTWIPDPKNSNQYQGSDKDKITV